MLWIKPRKNRFYGLVSGREHNSWSQKIKTMREWYFTHLPGLPHCGDRFAFWLAGSYRRRNHPCEILWQSVQGFRSSDTPNFALLHRNSWSPLQQCKHYRATLWKLRETHVGVAIVTMANVLCSNFVKFDRWEIGEIVRYLPEKCACGSLSSAVATARVAPKICQGQSPTMD